jgi:mannose-1-phosphate guanylyltransferase
VKVLPIIICGGSGSRLFPENNNNLPKQFIDFGGWNMFKKAIERISSKHFLPPIISTNIKYVNIIKYFLKKYKLNNIKIISEPEKKNTAPAILSSILNPDINFDQPVLWIPSDQLIVEKNIFIKSILKNLDKLNHDNIFVFGIKPKEASDQFGYILSKKNSMMVSKFVEKPKIKIAKNIIKKGGCWNAGIFLAKKSSIINNFNKFQPKLYNLANQAYENSITKKNLITLNKKYYSKISPISFDYAILENSKNINVIKLNVNWTDLGSWKSIHFFFNKNKLNYFNKNNVFYRPWGSYTNLFRGKNFLIKEISVNKKSSLSLQSHKHRSEYWTIINGRPLITINKRKFIPKLNETVFIPKGAIHRIENQKIEKVKIIEAQVGNILKETDIKRYEDIYGRVKK